MKKRIPTLLLPFAALILELLPYGAVLNFADPDAGVVRTTFSYFDPTVFGYANFPPMICGILTAVLLLFGGLYLALGNRGTLRTVAILSALTFVISALPVLYGAYSVIGGFISALLLANAVAAFIAYCKCENQ